MATTADVVIIGGGIAGASAAYHLTKNGIRNVQLVEMKSLGSGTTAYTAGWVMLQETSEIKIRMTQASYEELRTLNEEDSIGFQIRGSLSVNTSEFSNDQMEKANLRRSLGVPIDILTTKEIKSMAPILKADDLGIGTYCKDDGLVDAHALLQAYVRRAKSLGARISESVKVLGIKTSDSRVVGVETTDGFINSPVIVNATGIYAKQIGKLIGLDLPIQNALRHNVYTAPIASVPEGMPLIEVLNPEVIYLGSSGKRVDYTIGTFDTDSYEHKPNLDLLLERHLNDLIYRVPEVAEARIIDCTAGIRSITPDGLPILGPVDGIEGYINDCGWAGNGIMYAPIGGQLVADYIAHKKTTPINIEQFSLSRFKHQRRSG